jgi:tryptophan-rich sensory protein
VFSPVQFGLRNLPLSAIVIVWTTILWAMKTIWPHHRWIAVAQIPYLIWVTIATVLQFTITWNN